MYPQHTQMANMKHVTIHGNKFYYDNDWYRKTGWMNDEKFETLWIKDPESHEKEESILIKEYIEPDNSVLELGGFIGTTACLINDIIKKKESHVVVEICPKYIKYLTKNKEKNNKKFIIHSSKVEKIEELSKYGIKFDALVMDIEGDEYPFIINNIDYIARNIKTIIAEIHPKQGLSALGDKITDWRFPERYRGPPWPVGTGVWRYLWDQSHPFRLLLWKHGFKLTDKQRGTHVWERK